MSSIYRDFFSNTGHDDVCTQFDANSYIDNIESIEPLIPADFDGTILTPVPKEDTTKVRKEWGAVHLPSALNKVKLFERLTKREPTVHVSRKSMFLDSHGVYRLKSCKVSLQAKLSDLPKVNRYINKCLAALAKINKLRQSIDASPWTLKQFLVTSIKSYDDFLFFTFPIKDEEAEWQKHELDGFNKMYERDNKAETFTFYYEPERRYLPAYKALVKLVKQCQELNITKYYRKELGLVGAVNFCFTAGGKVKTFSRRINDISFDGNCFCIRIPWVEDQLFWVNYDKKIFTLVKE